MRRYRAAAAVAVATVALLGVAGCGDDDDDSANSFCDVDTSDIDPATPEGAKDAVDLINRVLDNNPPAEVRDDLTTMRDGLQAASDADTDAERVALAEQLGEFQAATDRLQEYDEQNC